MIRKMFLRTAGIVAVLAAVMLMGCGTSTTGPDGGSRAQTMTGVSEASGYPAGKPKDAESPALASSGEQQNSKVGPKVPVSDPKK